MTFNDLMYRAILIEADQGHMLGRIHNPSGFKTQSSSAGIGHYKQDPNERKAREYYKGGPLPKGVERGSISTPPEVKSTYNTIKEALKIVASRENIAPKLTKMFISYMTEYEKIWGLNETVETCIKYLQDTIRKVEKAEAEGQDTIKRKGANGSMFEVDGQEAITECEENLHEAEAALNQHINFIIDDQRPAAYALIQEYIVAACKELYLEVKEKATNFGTTVGKQFVSEFGENAEALFKTVAAFITSDEAKKTGPAAFDKYKEFVEHRSDNIIYNDIIKTLNEWYKNILLRYPKQTGSELVSLKPANKSIQLPVPYNNLINQFRKYSSTKDSMPELIELISRTSAFTDHEKSMFADAIVSFYEGQGTEASVVRVIRDAGEHIA